MPVYLHAAVGGNEDVFPPVDLARLDEIPKLARRVIFTSGVTISSFLALNDVVRVERGVRTVALFAFALEFFRLFKRHTARCAARSPRRAP